MTTTPTASDRGQEAAAAAADQGKHLGDVAAEEAQSVAGDAKEQFQALLDDTLRQVNEQSSVQRDRLVELLRGLSRDLLEMANQADGSSLAGQLVRQGADRADGASSSLEGREPADLVEDVRRFARRKPGVFLAGALVAGVMVGRFARGAKDAQSCSDLGQGTGSSHDRDNPVPRPVTGPLDTTQATAPPMTTTGEAPPSSYGTTPDRDPAFGDPPVVTP